MVMRENQNNVNNEYPFLRLSIQFVLTMKF